MPVEGIISGVYGSQRILNGKPKWPHYGIDIAAKKGTLIKSSASGTVTMAEDDLYYTGGTIIMDHGHRNFYITPILKMSWSQLVTHQSRRYHRISWFNWKIYRASFRF